jgi:cysteine desulfurase / selenocysteine lyase
MTQYDLGRARSYFGLNKGVTYLNHAAHSPLPLPVREVFDKFLDSWQKTAHEHDAESFSMFETLRGKLAGFIGAKSDRIGYAPHTTFGMNVIASGLRWNPGDNIVISEKEFPASVYPWLKLRNKGVEIRFAPTHGGFIDENSLISCVDKNTRLIHSSWVQYNNGYRVDVAKLGKFCSENNIVFSVDGIQGTGAVPIDVPAAKIDHFTCGCQKWMLAPCGSGFYYLSEKVESLMDPPYLGWMSVDWKMDFGDLMRYNLEPRLGPARYEIGSYPFQDLRALNAAVDILLSFERQAVWNHIRSLIDRLINYLSNRPGFEIVSSTAPERRSGILSFKTENCRALYDFLTSQGFIISFRENGIRVSPHFYNSPDEIDALLDSISEFKK